MKFPKLFGKKTSDDDEDEDETEAGPAEEEAEPGPTDDEEEDEGHPAASSRKILFLAVGGGGLAAVLLVGGVAWWIFGGSSESEPAAAKPMEGNADRVVLDIPPRPGANQGRQKPQSGQPLSATDTLNAIAALTEGPGAGIVVQPVNMAAFTDIPAAPPAQPLAKAPDPDLTEQSAQGPLPKIGASGKKPWQAYARPFPADDKRPRVAVVVGGLGMSGEATQGAIAHLPAAVTLAFDPYASGLADWASKARAAGHEVLLELPMEPADFPVSDPGPRALATGVSTADNLGRLNGMLSLLSGYVGVITLMGSRFLLDEDQVKPILDSLNKRGLLFVESGGIRDSVAPEIGKQLGLPRARADLVIDEEPSRAAIGRRLGQLEDAARRGGAAVGVASSYPVTVERLLAWAATLEGRGLALAPVSAVAARQSTP